MTICEAFGFISHHFDDYNKIITSIPSMPLFSSPTRRLSDDILLEIADHLNPSTNEDKFTLLQLRLVCRRYNELICPRAFSHLTCISGSIQTDSSFKHNYDFLCHSSYQHIHTSIKHLTITSASTSRTAFSSAYGQLTPCQLRNMTLLLSNLQTLTLANITWTACIHSAPQPHFFLTPHRVKHLILDNIFYSGQKNILYHILDTIQPQTSLSFTRISHWTKNNASPPTSAIVLPSIIAHHLNESILGSILPFVTQLKSLAMNDLSVTESFLLVEDSLILHHHTLETLLLGFSTPATWQGMYRIHNKL